MRSKLCYIWCVIKLSGRITEALCALASLAEFCSLCTTQRGILYLYSQYFTSYAFYFQGKKIYLHLHLLSEDSASSRPSAGNLLQVVFKWEGSFRIIIQNPLMFYIKPNLLSDTYGFQNNWHAIKICKKVPGIKMKMAHSWRRCLSSAWKWPSLMDPLVGEQKGDKCPEWDCHLHTVVQLPANLHLLEVWYLHRNVQFDKRGWTQDGLNFIRTDQTILIPS